MQDPNTKSRDGIIRTVLGLLVTAVFVAGIGFSWSRAFYGYNANPGQISSEEKLEESLQKYHGPNRPVRIGTGIFVQSLQFESATTVQITGYVWQRVSVPPDSGLAEAYLGVLFPEAVEGGIEKDAAFSQSTIKTVQVNDHASASEPVKNEIGDFVVMGNEESIPVEEVVRGWRFSVVLNQPFNYRRFPFDQKDVWIRLWPKSFTQNLVLVPLLDSYSDVSEGVEFGLGKSVGLEGWDTEESYFELRHHRYKMVFGLHDWPKAESNSELDQPVVGVVGLAPPVGRFNQNSRLDPADDFGTDELYFSIILRRQFLNPFIQDLLPILIVLALLFGVLLTVHTIPKDVETLGFSFGATLASAAALFFVVIFSHVHLRQSTGGTGIVYLETFYIATYCAIGLVCFVAFCAASGWGQRFMPRLHQTNYGAFKLLYWPILTGGGLLLTMYYLSTWPFDSDAASGPHGTRNYFAWKFLTAGVVILGALVWFTLSRMRRGLQSIDEFADLEKGQAHSDAAPLGFVELGEDETPDPIDTFIG